MQLSDILFIIIALQTVTITIDIVNTITLYFYPRIVNNINNFPDETYSTSELKVENCKSKESLKESEFDMYEGFRAHAPPRDELV